MSTRVCDVAVIGAGSAGMVAWRAAREHAGSVLLIEAGAYGTLCARSGCMPSKLLIAAATAAESVRRASTFGVDAGAPRIDGEQVMRRVRGERDRFVGHVLATIDDIPANDRLKGRARFVGPQVLQLDDGTRVEAGRIVIATGSRSVLPPVLQALADRVDTHETLFEWPSLPASVAVIGAGVIGLELGQALARLGVRVRVFGRGAGLAGIDDEAVRAVAEEILGDELPLVLRSELRAVTPVAGGFEVVADTAEGEYRDVFERVLAATGRRPDLAGLDLENSGLALDARGIPLHDPTTGQCGDRPVFIAGDVSGDRPLLHEAAHAGRVAGGNAGRWPEVRAVPRLAAMGVVFTAPQVARVGESFAALCRRDADFAAGEVRFENQGRARVDAMNRGILRIYAERGSGRLLGAEMIAPQAEHLAHLLAWAIQARLDVAQALHMPFYHPVIEEGLRTALRDTARALRMARQPAPGCLEAGPGV